jgi:hypothetical protein
MATVFLSPIIAVHANTVCKKIYRYRIGRVQRFGVKQAIAFFT